MHNGTDSGCSHRSIRQRTSEQKKTTQEVNLPRVKGATDAMTAINLEDAKPFAAFLPPATPKLNQQPDSGSSKVQSAHERKLPHQSAALWSVFRKSAPQKRSISTSGTFLRSEQHAYVVHPEARPASVQDIFPSSSPILVISPLLRWVSIQPNNIDQYCTVTYIITTGSLAF